MRLMARSNRHDAGGRRVEAVRPKPSTLNFTAHSLQPMAAASRFGRYGPMEKHDVRGLKIDGTELDRLRARRQMLREMDPEQALQVIEFRRDLNFLQALALAKQEGSLIVPNDVHDRILTETIDEQYLRQNYPVWTGTLVIYEKPNAPFGEKVVLNSRVHQLNYSISFAVPEQFQGKTNCALVVEHPDFELINLKDNRYKIKLLEGASINLIENFPTHSQRWYNTDPETKIPIGEPVRKSEKDARYLCRLDGHYLGPVARDVDFGGYDRQVADAYYWSTVRFGVALMPLAAATEKSDSHD